MAKLKNKYGEYNYHFNWMDEDGRTTGFNNVWAQNKANARVAAKARETKAGWRMFDVKLDKYINVDNEVDGADCFYSKGMYVDMSSMYKADAEQRDAMNRMGWMLTQ